MALQIRRGLEADLPASPADGELLYATDTNKLYVGDGGVAQEISGGTGGGGLANVVEDTTPELGGNLDVNGFEIFSTGTNHVILNPRNTGEIKAYGPTEFTGNLKSASTLVLEATTAVQIGSIADAVDGRLVIVRNTHSSTLTGGFSFQQHHETADATNFTFYRSRGTASIPAAVQNGDDIADLTFLGHSAAGISAAAGISVTVDGVPPSNRVPGKISFLTDNGTNTGVRAELSAAGVWKVNSLQNYSGTDLTLTATNIKMVGNVQLNAQGDLRFADSDSSNWVAFQAPTTVSSNITWTLPAADGASGEVLSTDGSGTLSWVTASGGGTSLGSRATVAGTSASLSNGASGDIDITGYKGYILYKIQTSVASWVRLYTDSASRTADNSRLEGTDPLPSAGVIAEVITTGASTILISPGAFGFNNEGSPTTNIPVRVTNKSGSTTDVTVTLVVVQLEA